VISTPSPHALFPYKKSGLQNNGLERKRPKYLPLDTWPPRRSRVATLGCCVLFCLNKSKKQKASVS